MIDPPSDVLPIGTVIGDYRIDGLLGRGGFSITYSATNQVLGSQVALKEFFLLDRSKRDGANVIHPDRVNSRAIADVAARFEAEVRLLARLRHRNLVTCHGMLACNGTSYIVLEKLDGPTLDAWLADRQRRPDEGDLRRVLAPILDAVSYLHAAGIVHADINPRNIILARDRPVLIDLGSFRLDLISGLPAPSFEAPVVDAVDEAFAPPEQLRSTGHVHDRPFLDTYALGATLYAAIVGKPPAPALDRAIGVATGEGDPYRPLAPGSSARAYPAHLLAAIDQALALDPRQRFQSIAALRRALGWTSKDVRPGTPSGAARAQVEPHAPTASIRSPPLQPLPVSELLALRSRRTRQAGGPDRPASAVLPSPESGSAYHYTRLAAVTRVIATTVVVAATTVVMPEAGSAAPIPPLPSAPISPPAVERTPRVERAAGTAQAATRLAPRSYEPDLGARTVASAGRRTPERRDDIPASPEPWRASMGLLRRGSGRLRLLALLAGTGLGASLAYVFRHEIASLLAGVTHLLWTSTTALAPAAPSERIVDVSVFAPPGAAPDAELLVQVLVSDFEEAKERVESLAAEADPSASRRGVATLDVPIKIGDRLDFSLEAAGLNIEDPLESLVWRGRTRSCAFIVKVPADFASARAHLRVRVLLDAVPVGQIRFTLDIAAQREPARPVAVGDAAARFSRAFLSYASADRVEVLKRAQSLRAARIDFFQDLLSLEPGDRWAKRLFEEIDHCDLFLLFWSTAAKNSDWVLREASYALDLHKRTGGRTPEIIPVILEGPPPPVPPASLGDIQFDDYLCYVIAALDKLQTVRAAN